MNEIENLVVLNSKEMQETHGGLAPLAWLAIIGGVALVGFIIGYSAAKE
jgi:lactobin A/cerein 7B family class IIb bacteriocin